jgi:hypothetical protein
MARNEALERSVSQSGEARQDAGYSSETAVLLYNGPHVKTSNEELMVNNRS